MSQQTLYMADIIMPTAPPTNNDLITYALPLLAGLFIIAAAYFMWRYWFAPQRCILRSLKRDKINSRQAVHALAKIVHNKKDKDHLNQLRFSRKPPTNKQVISFIQNYEFYDG